MAQTIVIANATYADVPALEVNKSGGGTALTEIHFALANKTAVEAMTGYSVKWGAPSSCQILFDL